MGMPLYPVELALRFQKSLERAMLPGGRKQAKSIGQYQAVSLGTLAVFTVWVRSQAKRGWRNRQPLDEFGSPSWTRTNDLRINSPSLYRLSYRGSES